MDAFHRDVLTSIFDWFDPATQALARFVCTRWWRLIKPVRSFRYSSTYWTGGGILMPVVTANSKVRVCLYTRSFPLFQWAINQKFVYDQSEVSLYAAINRNTEVLLWQHEKGDLTTDVYTDLAWQGALEMMQAIHQLKDTSGNSIYPVPFVCADAAMKSTRAKEILKWLIELGMEPSSTAINAAIEAGHPIEMLDWLYERGFPISDSATYFAARRGLNVIQWIRERNGAWHHMVYDAASAIGSVEILDYLSSQNAPLVNMDHVPIDGNLEVIKWWYSKGYPLDESAYECVTDIDILEWLHQQSCPKPKCGDEVVYYHGNIKALQWLHRHGISFTQSALRTAFIRKHFDVVDWLITPSNTEKPICSLYSGIYAHVIDWRDTDILDYLYNRGYPLTNQPCVYLSTPLQTAINREYIPAIQWLIEHGYLIKDEPVSPMDYAFRRKASPKLIGYLRTILPP